MPVVQRPSGKVYPAEGWSGQASPDLGLVRALRDGNEPAFVTLVEDHQAALLRLAMVYVKTSSIAEEVVQETWLGVLRGLQDFEGRSSLKTWIFRILINIAKSRAVREGRSIPFSSLDSRLDDTEPSVASGRFLSSDAAECPGHWARPAHAWSQTPEELALSSEVRVRIHEAIYQLPPGQQEVITLRDVEGWSAGETCTVLGITETNQRVLLHRARSKVRTALEGYFDSDRQNRDVIVISPVMHLIHRGSVGRRAKTPTMQPRA